MLAAMSLGLPFWVGAPGRPCRLALRARRAASSGCSSIRCCGTACLPLAIATMALVDLPQGGRQGFLRRRGAALPVALPGDRRRRSSAPRSRCRASASSSSRVVAVRRPAALPDAHAAPAARCRRRRRTRPSRASSASRRAHDPLHLPDQRRARRARLVRWSRRSISPSSPTANTSAWPPSSRRSSAASTRSAARIAGGLLLGVVDNLAAAYVSTQYRAAIPLFLLIAVILFRPQGLLGRAEERTV